MNKNKGSEKRKGPDPSQRVLIIFLMLSLLLTFNKLNSLSREKEDLQKELDDLEEDKNKKEKIIQNIKKDKEELQSKLDDLKKDYEELNKSSEEDKKKREELDTKINELELEKKSLEKKIKKLSTQVTRGDNRRNRGNVSTGLTSRSGFTANDFNKAFEGTGMAGLGSSIIEAENRYGVNGLFLASIASLESGWGNSYAARYRNNLTGFGGGRTRFSSKHDCLMQTASLLSKNYLNPNGKYYSKSFGATLKGVNQYYCEQKSWAGKISNQMNHISNKIKK